MAKKIFIFTLLSVFSISIYAKEPTLAFLNKVISNELQQYRIGRNSFYCKPYGVVTVDELYKNATMDSICKKSIEDFYVKNPEEKYFYTQLFKLEQMYHIEFKNNECLVFVQGQKSLSEVLLENGLAFEEFMLRDKEYSFSFSQAQKRARYEKKGLWGTKLMRSCIMQLYK